MPSTTVPTKLKKVQMRNAGGTSIDFDTDTIKVMIVTVGSGMPSTTKTGVQFVADVTATNTEVSGAGYARQTVAGSVVDFDGSIDTYVNWSFSDVTFAFNAGGFTDGAFIIFYDETAGASDADRPVLAVCDPGVTMSTQAGAVVLTCPAGGLIQWQ